MKKTMKKTAAALCIAATLISVAAPAMAVSPAEYMSTAALEECNTATVAQVESLINQIGTVTTARRPAIVAAVNAYNELDDASKAQVSNFAVLAEAQQVLGLKDALAKLKISYDKVEDARSYVSPTEDRLSNQGKSYILPFFVNGSTNDPSMFFMVLCSGNKYVYLDTITIRAGEYKYTYTIDWTDVDRGYDGKQYWELTSFVGDDEDIQWFKNILSADEIIIRYSGDGGSIDHTVTPEERQANQSVNERVMISRIDQQIRVNKIMVDAFDLWKIPNRKLRHYMFNYLEIITVISTIMLIRSGTEENLEKKRELWKYIREKDIRLFHHLRAGILGNTMNLPGKGGRKISVAAYKLSQKVVGFN